MFRGESERGKLDRADSVSIILAPAIPEVTPGPTGEVTEEVAREGGTKLALSRHQVEILHKCQEDKTLLELITIAGRSDRTKFRHQVLNPLLEGGLIEMTIPDKPRSSRQKYRLTGRGRRFLAERAGYPE